MKKLIDDAKTHVFKGSKLRYVAKENQYKYAGIHTRSGIERLVKENGNGQYILKNMRINPKTGVYEAVPEIILKDGTVISHNGNKGICSFFPDSWSEEKILSEVEYASQNIIGKYKNIRNGYVGLSSDGKIKIVIQYDEYTNNGTLIKKITSFYPLFE